MLTHLIVPMSTWRETPSLLEGHEGTVVVSFVGGSTPTLLGALGSLVRRAVGTWLEVSDEYPASLGARDVKTLAQLVDLRDVVVASRDFQAEQHARIVAAMLRDEPTTLVTPVGSVTSAYNRPAPPRPITTWWCDDDTIRNGRETLRRTSSANDNGVVREVFA